jgi:septal ring factor EnvC (AmiA/AmiB activator)
MSYNSEYSATNPTPAPKKRDDRKIIYGVLIAALLATWGYIIYDKSKTNESITQLQTQYTNVDSARNEVQNEYNNALARLDSATGDNTQLKGALSERQSEIDNLKRQITGITNKRNATAGELERARGLINQLNMRIDDMYAEIQRLKSENQQLASSNRSLTKERQQLTTERAQLQENLSSTESARREVEDVASTLHASNLNITPLKVKGNGKERETETAKRVDLLRISFNVDENMIAQSGNKELYVTVTAPDGRPVTMASGSGTFDTRNEGSKTYTNKVTVPYEQGKRFPVTFDWKQEGKYQMGAYKIEVYHNGFKIGEATRTLKKGGLFG